ncbi:MAG: S4 domain-containing protein, partial [Endomicrobiia bacterium]
EETAKKEQQEFDKVFSKKELPTDIPTVFVKKDKYELLDLLVNYNLVSSKSEAKRLLKQQAIKVNLQKVKENIILDFVKNQEVLIQIGKLKFVKLQPK